MRLNGTIMATAAHHGRRRADARSAPLVRTRRRRTPPRHSRRTRSKRSRSTRRRRSTRIKVRPTRLSAERAQSTSPAVDRRGARHRCEHRARRRLGSPATCRDSIARGRGVGLEVASIARARHADLGRFPRSSNFTGSAWTSSVHWAPADRVGRRRPAAAECGVEPCRQLGVEHRGASISPARRPAIRLTWGYVEDPLRTVWAGLATKPTGGQTFCWGETDTSSFAKTPR